MPAWANQFPSFRYYFSFRTALRWSAVWLASWFFDPPRVGHEGTKTGKVPRVFRQQHHRLVENPKNAVQFSVNGGISRMESRDGQERFTRLLIESELQLLRWSADIQKGAAWCGSGSNTTNFRETEDE